MNLKSSILFLFLLLPFLGLTQKDMYAKGLLYYEAEQYNKALEYFYADKFASNNKELLIRRIICNYETGKLENAKKDVAKILTFDNYPPETFFLIGQIYHSEGNYDNAVDNYKTYLKLNPKAKNKPEVIHLIKQCGRARKLKYREADAFVDNFGNVVNTEYDEFRMIQSPNYSERYYFSSAREGSNGGRRDLRGNRDASFGFFNSDMYTVEMENGEWLPVRALNPFINTSRDELALDFSSDGSILFYMKGESYEKGVIYTDTFAVDKTEILNPPPLVSPINGTIGDNWLYLFNDKTILFSSKRPGGYGGYDLYVTHSIDGTWSKPKNLGPEINSKYDEISPCISKDGKELFFSSNRIESFGGYDVFKSSFDSPTKSWTSADNAGMQINSAGNDIGLYLSRDGNTAFLSSDRKEGFGGYDLYVVYFKNQIKAQLNTTNTLAFIANDDFVPFNAFSNIDSRKNTSSKASASNKKKEKKEVNNKKETITQTKSPKKEKKIAEKKVKKNPKKKVSKKVEKKPIENKVVEQTEKKKPTETEIKKASKEKEEKLAENKVIEETEKKTIEDKPKKKKEKKRKVKKEKKRTTKKETASTTKPKEKNSAYILNPVFFEKKEDIINPVSRKELDIVVALMKQYPKLEVILQAHTIEDGMDAVDLYFSIKRAEQIGSFLKENGIEGNRIYLKGYGSNYPIAKTESGGKPNKIAEKVNSRIEFQFKKTEGLPININLVQPYIIEYLRDPRGEIFKTVEEGLSYRVQVANVPQMYQNQVLLLYNDGMIERSFTESNYRYTLGLYESYTNARDLVNDLKNYDITGAFIVPYIDGIRIDKKDYKKYTPQYEDLLKFTQDQ